MVEPFLMPIADVFRTERGTVVIGRVERGTVRAGDEVEIVGLRPTARTVVTGVEQFRKILDQGKAGEDIYALLRDTKPDEVERGQVLAAPGSIAPHTRFECEAYILTKEKGGRDGPFSISRPQFDFYPAGPDGDVHAATVIGYISLPDDIRTVMPGEKIPMEIELLVPLAIDKGLSFAIREGDRTVATGVVAKILK